ncbi:PrsW family intramembrane metalloprotease [Crocinitomicaceae bacterium]|nr:PrsW family intramembrane metalloprotease [Crocinitomicaceae bacterium]
MKALIYILFSLILGFYLIGGVASYNTSLLISIVTALFFPICMIFFYRKIDIFEKEKLSHLFIVFFLSGILLHLIGEPIIYYRDTHLGGINDSFIRLFIGVGLFEEILKIIPVLLILRFRPLKKMNMINEPIDFIIYSSVSALGFAFFENIQYIDQYSNTENIVAIRSLLPLLVHTIFSSLIGFGLFCTRVTKDRGYFFIYLFIASLLHTLYDIGLISYVPEIVQTFAFYAVLAGSVTYYGELIHSMLNISPFYNEEKRNDINGAFKFLLVIIVGVFILDLIHMTYYSESQNLLQNIGNYDVYFFIMCMVIYSQIGQYLYTKKGRFIINTDAQDAIIKNFYNNLEKEESSSN